jgi:hypothetical protein
MQIDSLEWWPRWNSSVENGLENLKISYSVCVFKIIYFFKKKEHSGTQLTN